MYHCHIYFYLIGRQKKIGEMIKKISPLEHFTHEFFESSMPEEELTAKADVILADLQDIDEKETLQLLKLKKRRDAQIILFADQEQIMLLEDDLSEVNDIWTKPMSDKEAVFRFLRWQQTYKMSKDFWQTSNYLETTINHIPNLIWYKDKNGIHEKVNDSFCKTVNKTKEQVEGQRHAYIWDVDQDDPACIASENEVMTKKKPVSPRKLLKSRMASDCLLPINHRFMTLIKV